MREILFRGKRIDSGEWVEGGYRHEKVGAYLTAVFIIEPLTSGVWEHHRVDPSTVGQYTGLTDKNGKRIFEGDVVKFTRFNALGYATRRVGDVRYYDELPIFYIMATTGDAWDWCDCEDIEVIGNIHDNRLEDFDGG